MRCCDCFPKAAPLRHMQSKSILKKALPFMHHGDYFPKVVSPRCLQGKANLAFHILFMSHRGCFPKAAPLWHVKSKNEPQPCGPR